MTPDQYPMCKSVGLRPWQCARDQFAVDASDVERLLSEGVRVRAYTGPASRPGGMWIDYGQHDADSDKEGLLIDIKPIAPPGRSATLTETKFFEKMLNIGFNMKEIKVAAEVLFSRDEQ